MLDGFRLGRFLALSILTVVVTMVPAAADTATCHSVQIESIDSLRALIDTTEATLETVLSTLTDSRPGASETVVLDSLVQYRLDSLLVDLMESLSVSPIDERAIGCVLGEVQRIVHVSANHRCICSDDAPLLRNALHA